MFQPEKLMHGSVLVDPPQLVIGIISWLAAGWDNQRNKTCCL